MLTLQLHLQLTGTGSQRTKTGDSLTAVFMGTAHGPPPGWLSPKEWCVPPRGSAPELYGGERKGLQPSRPTGQHRRTFQGGLYKI